MDAPHEPLVSPAMPVDRSTALRAGDADRDATSAVLQEALAAGYLTMPEFEEREGQVWQATTIGRLRTLLADLPSDRLKPAPAAAPGPSAAADVVTGGRRDHARGGLRAHAGSYAAGSAIMLAIWLIVGFTTGSWYFWPVWPILGWGIGVFSHAAPVLSGRGGCWPRRAGALPR